MVGRIEQGTEQGDACGRIAAPAQVFRHFGGLDPDGLGAGAEPVAAEAKAAREFGAAGEAAQLGAENPLGEGEVAPIGVGVGGDEQIRLEPAQQLTHVAPTEQERARFDQVFELHQAPIGLMDPGGVLLNPVVELHAPPVRAAGVLQHLFDPHLAARIPLAQPIPQGFRGGVVGGAPTGGEDQNPHRAMVPFVPRAKGPTAGAGSVLGADRSRPFPPQASKLW